MKGILKPGRAMNMMRGRPGICLLLLLLLCCVSRPVRAATDVLDLRPSGGSAAFSSGGDWEGLKNALIEARTSGKTEVAFRLNGDTFSDFLKNSALWYHAARAGLKNASCVYWDDGRISLTELEWWPWPMYLVHSMEDVVDALREQKDGSGRTFGFLPDRDLYQALAENGQQTVRTRYRAGLTGYETMYYDDGRCALWYVGPVLEDTVYLEASGPASCVEALRGAALSGARIVLQPDRETYARLSRDDDLRGRVFGSAGLRSSFQNVESAGLYLFPVPSGAFYPGFMIAELVRSGREDLLTNDQRRVLARARELVRDVRGTDLEKARQIHDRLCALITYTIDDSTDDDDCCVGALLDGRANCDGYSDAFMLCASLCGLTVRYIEGDSLEKDQPREEAGHMWNLIFLDGLWTSLDVTWGDQEDNGVSYRYFNIGLDRMEKSYAFSRELLPAPFSGQTDLTARPVREWTVGSAGELSAAVTQAVSAGQDTIVVNCSQSLFSAYLRDSGVVWYAVSSAGAQAGSLLYNETDRTITLKELQKRERWIFCQTRDDVAKAAVRMRNERAQSYDLTLEKNLFSALMGDENRTELYMLLARGGIFSAGLSWQESACTVTVQDPKWREGWYAEKIGTEAQLSDAVREGVSRGCSNFYLCLTDSLYRRMMDDTQRLAQAVRDGGFSGGWSYYHWDDRLSVYIVSK